MHPKSGQIAMEYLMVVALISIVIVPTTFLFYNYASDSSEQIDRAQIDKFGREIVTTAETVYYLGYPSRIVLEEKLPSNVESASIAQDPVTGTYLLLMDVRTRNGVANFSYPTQVNIAGIFGENDTSAGIKRVRIESTPPIGGKSLVTLNFGENATCNDNTIHEVCSAEKPKYCYNSVLIDNCQECGCPSIISELQCKPDGTCMLPKVNSVNPQLGLVSGGTAITITGTGFISGASVTIGGNPATANFVSSTQIDAFTPAGSSGSADVAVTNSDGGSGVLTAGFTYIPPPTVSSVTPALGPVSGGTPVVITGTDFISGATVRMAGVNAINATVVSATSITALTPDGVQAGQHNVMVLNYAGGNYTLTGGFNFTPVPKVFVTSTTSNGNLGGISGGDALCQARAASVSLPGIWKSWLSTSNVNASARIADQEYVRMDNKLIARSIADLTDGSIANNISRDESNIHVGNIPVWTGTIKNGTADANTCSSWTSTAGNGLIGVSGAKIVLWTKALSFACTNSYSLYCFEQTARVFVTSLQYDGLLGSIAEADAVCQSHANIASLGGTWKAWLSTTTTNAKSRITDAKYVLVDGTPVANNLTDLTDGSLQNPINLDENGVVTSGEVWTGTLETGLYNSAYGDCTGWNSLASTSSQGLSDSADSSWTRIDFGLSCAAEARFYCFQAS